MVQPLAPVLAWQHLACFVAGPFADCLLGNAPMPLCTNLETMLVALFDESHDCDPREDCAVALDLIARLPIEQVSAAIIAGHRAAFLAVSIYRRNGQALFDLALACRPDVAVSITEDELVALVEGHSPTWAISRRRDAFDCAPVPLTPLHRDCASRRR
jgi:hypothetical protein